MALHNMEIEILSSVVTQTMPIKNKTSVGCLI